MRSASPNFVPTLLHQVSARLDRFFPGCAVDVQEVLNANAVTLGVRISADTGFLRPVHCGFGITQILPIIVAALSIPKGDLLLIENPEVHLHPAGQALMGQFLAEVAHSGIQVIVETHSDHILNGIRRAIKVGKHTGRGCSASLLSGACSRRSPSADAGTGQYREH